MVHARLLAAPALPFRCRGSLRFRPAQSEPIGAARDALRRESQCTARVLVFLADIEERQLHLQRGFPSMYAFCASQLDLLDGKAYRRIEAARLGRRFPVVLELPSRLGPTLTALAAGPTAFGKEDPQVHCTRAT